MTNNATRVFPTYYVNRNVTGKKFRTMKEDAAAALDHIADTVTKGDKDLFFFKFKSGKHWFAANSRYNDKKEVMDIWVDFCSETLTSHVITERQARRDRRVNRHTEVDA